MKAIFSLIKVAIIFAIIAGCFFLLINKTFIYEQYKGELMEGDGFSISRFLYFLKEDNDLNVSFISPLSLNSLKESKEKYLKDLITCYGEYYYDANNNITITKYSIVDNDYYRNVYISYALGNYCSEEYVLSDIWIYEYKSLSSYLEGDIGRENMNLLVDAIYNSTRVTEPIKNNYVGQIDLNVKCSINGIDYELEFKDFSESELMVIKKYQGINKVAVYKIENVVNYLQELKN